MKNVQRLTEGLSNSLRVLHKETLNPFDIFIVRECVEPAIVVLTVDTATEEQISSMEKHLEFMRLASGENLDECFANNVRFHFSIIKATNNDVAVAMLGSVYEVMKIGYEEDRLWRKIIHEYHCSEQNCQQCFLDHKAILTAIKARDPSLARKCYMQHFRNMRREILFWEDRRMKKQPS